ncbi:golvesin C-terminal-like domain-containing protein [Rubrobacter aplysinae]|uniref:golvesin C-terminal-like domain-containing protein n=1 Tax=Rubrobacter aplysinae TaxID=909625 RepID=UPI00069F1B4A|nr:N-acetylmuramoyl-L-alanine amidase [Rubrobacter aplysinae]
MAKEPSTVWYPAHPNNFTSANRPASDPIDWVVIHVTQGSWSSALNWFQNPSAGVSAHYTVRSSDGKLGQSLSELNIGYHAGNWTVNRRSVGIEHEGYVSDPSWFTGAMYRSSARLTAYLCDRFNIPADRDHIFGHNEVSGASHTDPGRYWDWNKYLGYVRDFSGSASGGYEQIVDNASGRFSASRGWKASSWSGERYGKNYRYTKPAARNDTARYRFKVPSTGRYEVQAWWPSTSGYNASTPVGINTTSGLEWVRVDQRRNGGEWVTLGTFEMAAGDRENVRVSRWTGGKGYVVADSVRIVSA